MNTQTKPSTSGNVFKAKASASRAAKREGFEIGTFEVVSCEGEGYTWLGQLTEETSTKAKGERDSSTIPGPCAVVWEICAEMHEEARKDVIAKCVESGVAKNTARTQYQRWFVASKAS